MSSATGRTPSSAGAAAAAAHSRPVRQGTGRAGTGAHAAALKGGVGSASVVTPEGITVAALVVVNSGGSPVDPATGELWGARHGIGAEFAELRRPLRREVAAFRQLAFTPPTLNTTLAVVATDATLTKAECTRLAGGGHDGMARAINPIHTYTDGDVCFTLATGARELPEAPREGFIRPAVARFAQLAVDHRRRRRHRRQGDRPRHAGRHVGRDDDQLPRPAPVGHRTPSLMELPTLVGSG